MSWAERFCPRSGFFRRNPRGFLLVPLALLAATPARAPIDHPAPDRCDAYVRFDGSVRLSPGRALAPNAIVIVGLSAQKAASQIAAWVARDADRFYKDTPGSFRLLRPDGTVLTRSDLVDATRARMAMVRSLDSITVAIRVDTLASDSAVVRSRQFFSRVVALPDSTLRRRFTSATHREVWLRGDSSWEMRDFTEENQVAEWVGEAERIR